MEVNLDSILEKYREMFLDFQDDPSLRKGIERLFDLIEHDLITLKKRS